MIYNPSPGEWPLLVQFRRALSSGVEQAAILAAIDFIAKKNQPWALYAGVAAGVTAAACGVPGGAATLYVIGDVLDFYVFKSPQGGTLRVFLDGVSISTVHSYAASQLWEAVQVSLTGDPNKPKRVDIVNDGVDPNHPNPDDSYWTAFRAPFTVSNSAGGGAAIVGADGAHLLNVWQVSITIEDDKRQKSVFSCNIKTPDVIASPSDDPFAFAAALTTKVKQLIAGRITNVNVSRRLPLQAAWTSGGQPTADVEEKCEFSFKPNGTVIPATVTVPAIDEMLVVGYELDTDTVEADDFITMMISPFSLPERWNVRPCDSRGNPFVALNRTQVTFARSRSYRDDDE